MLQSVHHTKQDLVTRACEPAMTNLDSGTPWQHSCSYKYLHAAQPPSDQACAGFLASWGCGQGQAKQVGVRVGSGQADGGEGKV